MKQINSTKGKPRCKHCGFRIRGDQVNHDRGYHHNNSPRVDSDGNHLPVGPFRRR